VREARGQVLTHGDMAAANSFESPDRVKPASLPVSEAGGEARVRVPKQAVAALQLRLV
jgi:alpha-L-arabinofuranosidase